MCLEMISGTRVIWASSTSSVTVRQIFERNIFIARGEKSRQGLPRVIGKSFGRRSIKKAVVASNSYCFLADNDDGVLFGYIVVVSSQFIAQACHPSDLRSSLPTSSSSLTVTVFQLLGHHHLPRTLRWPLPSVSFSLVGHDGAVVVADDGFYPTLCKWAAFSGNALSN